MENNEKKSDNDEESNKCKVLIIGAGMAGLSAAYHLAKNGFNDYKILEARKRIGGRIIQIKIGPEAVELGANWIHGVLGNPVYELAMHHGLVDIMQDPKIHKVVAATELGKQIPFGILQEIYEAYLVFLRRCEEYYLSQYLPPDGIDSVGDHIKLEINLYLDKFKDPQDRYLRQLLFDCLLKRESCISGCDSMSEIDLLEIGSYTELQGGNITLPGGYSSILEPMKKVISQDKVFLEHAVCSIKWNFNNSSDSGDESDDSDRTIIDDEPRGPPGDKFVEVMCENGNKFFAEHVICTLPLGVLKHNANKIFQPKLPDYKIEAIDRLLFGTVDKIYLEYDRPFLNANITEVLLLWEPDDRKEIDYTKNWYKKIYSFAKVSETLLLGWISGKEAEYMETLPSEVISETCTEILRKFLKDPFIPKPKNCICTSWFSQPFTKGSYTAIAVGASQIDIEYLAQPLYTKDNHDKPIVLFAGEHTHSNFYSTVHGAYLTGRTVAQILLSTDAPQEIVVDADEDDTDLSSWIQGICLD